MFRKGNNNMAKQGGHNWTYFDDFNDIKVSALDYHAPSRSYNFSALVNMILLAILTFGLNMIVKIYLSDKVPMYIGGLLSAYFIVGQY